jgi:hypothetical protein
MKKVFVLTSHVRNTGEKKQGFGQKNLLLYYELADKGVIDITNSRRSTTN